jgi:hypothetical protein
MKVTKADGGAGLYLRAGDIVEVRSKDEILATLDADGRRDALPFMPEMLQYCGRQFRVHKRAGKTCDTIWKTGARRMEHAVHLENVRCDGTAHGGCQAGCLIFWKDAWLKRAEPQGTPASAEETTATDPAPGCSEAAIYQATRRTTAGSADVEAFSCQTTELFDATSYLRWWDIRQYVSDLTSRNVTVKEFVRGTALSWFNAGIRIVRRVVFALGHAVTRGRARRVHGEDGGGSGVPAAGENTAAHTSMVVRVRTALEKLLVEYPHVRGRLHKTPSMRLDLTPGEYVQVRTRDEIIQTLDVHNRNRGLLFDVEMLPYCGGTYRVLRRVERILDERTGRLIRLPNNCIVLDGVVCGGCLSRNRLFCPRGIYPYWHEIWLKRVGETETAAVSRLTLRLEADPRP